MCFDFLHGDLFFELDLIVEAHMFLYILVNDAERVRLIFIQVCLSLEEGEKPIEKVFYALAALHCIHKHSIKRCVFLLHF